MTEVKNYRKRPVLIEAVQFDGTALSTQRITKWVKSYGQHAFYDARGLFISTPGGIMLADPRDWVIKSVRGEFYACHPQIFEDTYEEAQDD